MTTTIKFEKITKDILDSFVLNSHEKIIYVILKSFEKAPRGIRVSLNYLMDRTGIKSKMTLIKHLDRLQSLGLIVRHKPSSNETSVYYLSSSNRQSLLNKQNNYRKSLKTKMKLRWNVKKNNVDNVITLSSNKSSTE
jgi:DNA-binding HxlR family transcriptional regulator